MKKLLALALLFSLLLPMAAEAASGCYSAREAEAEQGLRIHSELMVIALTCIKVLPNGVMMYGKYQAFTQKNQPVITGYENDLISYFRNQGDKNPEVSFHNLRTGLANRISKISISMSTQSFCQQYGKNIDQALAMDQGKFRRWAQRPVAQNPNTHPMCK